MVTSAVRQSDHSVGRMEKRTVESGFSASGQSHRGLAPGNSAQASAAVLHKRTDRHARRDPQRSTRRAVFCVCDPLPKNRFWV